jgi:cytochrome P450
MDLMRRVRIQLIVAVGWVLRKYLRNPRLMSLLRRYPRLAWLPGATGLPLIRLAVRHEDAKRVLAHDREFAVPYLEKMQQLGAPFMLGLDASPDHTRQRDSVAVALDPVAMEQVADTSAAAAEAVLKGARDVDVVQELTDAVLRATVGRHLGTGEVDPAQLDAARMVFRHIFINPFNSPDVVEGSLAAARDLLEHMREVVRERRAAKGNGGAPGTDVLSRLLKAIDDRAEPHLRDDAEVVDQLVGVFVAWVASVSRSTAYALDALLDKPEAMARAHRAATDGDAEAMWAVLVEALRVQPPVPAIERVCRRETDVQGARVRREREVWVVLTAVTMDKSAYPAPHRFDANREQDNLTFGYDLHRCLGLGIAKSQMSAIAIALLRRPNVKRACALQLVGPYPSRLDVTLD